MAQAPRQSTQAKAPARPQRPGRVPTARRKAEAAAEAQAEEAPAPEAPAVEERPLAYLLIAENAVLADAQAQHEWGWKAAKAKGSWVDTAGNAVKFCPDLGALKAAAQDSRVSLYLGHRWYAAFPSHLVERLFADGSVTRLPDPTPDAPA